MRWRLDDGIPSVQATLRFENNKRSAVFAPIDVEEDSCLVTINGRSNKYSAIHPLCHKGLKMWFWEIPTDIVVKQTGREGSWHTVDIQSSFYSFLLLLVHLKLESKRTQ